MAPKETATRIDRAGHLAESYTPSPLPVGPGGVPIPPGPPPIYLPVVADDVICDRGPCRHRHVYTGNVDAMRPADGSELERPKLGPDGEPIVKRREADGTPVYETETYQPHEVVRACYPAPGVVLDLSADDPIMTCSRWDPEDATFDAADRARAERRRRYFEPALLERVTLGAAYVPGTLGEPVDPGDVEDMNRESTAHLRGRK